MLSRLKQAFWVLAPIAGLYYLLNHHFIFTTWKEFDILKKNELTLEQTFYSLSQSSPLQTLRIDSLRDAGIEDVLLKRGMVTEERLDEYLRMIDEDE